MGCFQSAYYNDIYSLNATMASWQSDFETLQFTEADIGALYYHFRRVDNDDSGEIEVAELLAFLDIEKTKFSKRVFCMFDEDNSGQIDFREFVLSCWNYCSLGRATLVVFAFDLYDKDSSGIIDQDEISQMLKDIYGKSWEKNSYAKRILERIKAELGDDIDITEFREFVRKYPALLFPAFNLQGELQKRIMGPDFWKYFSDRRMTLSNGKYIEIGEFMALHTNKGLAEKMQNTVQTDVIAPPRLGTGASARSKSMQNVLASTGTLASRRSSVSSKVHPNISTLVSLKEGQESKDGLARSGKIIGNGILTRKKSFSKTNINGNLSEKHPNMDRRKSITPVATPDNSEGNIRTNGSRRKTMGATHIVGSISNMNSSETCEGSDNATTISHRKRK